MAKAKTVAQNLLFPLTMGHYTTVKGSGGSWRKEYPGLKTASQAPPYHND
jgi:hypothetical protein